MCRARRARPMRASAVSSAPADTANPMLHVTFMPPRAVATGLAPWLRDAIVANADRQEAAGAE